MHCQSAYQTRFQFMITKTLMGLQAINVYVLTTEPAHQLPGSALPYQDSMMRCAIETGGGSSRSPLSTAARRSSRLYQCASAISSASTVISVLPVASARKPSIRLCGIGHGWLPRYLTAPTT